MRWNEISLNEGRDAPLFISFREEKYALMALRENRLAATSSQRFWPDGKRRKDTDPEYRSSYWMKGISTTRDIGYAKEWGHVLFSLDQTKISQRYKIIPFNWGFSTPSGTQHKREREEFIVIKSTPDTYIRSDDDGGGFDTNRFVNPEGYINNLSSFLTGIWISDMADDAEFYTNHPLFKGYYTLT